MDTFIKHLNGKYRWISHLLFWLLFVALYTLAYGSAYVNYKLKFYHTILLLPTIIPATYFTLHFLFKRLLLNKKTGLFLAGFLLSAFVFSFLQMLIEIKVIDPLLYERKPIISIKYILVAFIHVYAIVLLAGVLKLIKDYFISREQNTQLQIEKTEAEMKLLKGQINPHFLFNTLNNLYSLALKNDKNTANGILQLSHLMDYMLLQSTASQVGLQSEIELIKNYIDLEKLRYLDKLKSSFDIKGKPTSIKISPLLLLPFVENAFKHGISQNTNSNWLIIFLNIEKDHIKFSIENSKPETVKEQMLIKNHGIGLKNVKRRLELIYPGKHKLEINDNKHYFSVELLIKFM